MSRIRIAHPREPPALKHIAPAITWRMPLELVGYHNVSSIFTNLNRSIRVIRGFAETSAKSGHWAILFFAMERHIKNNDKLHQAVFSRNCSIGSN